MTVEKDLPSAVIVGSRQSDQEIFEAGCNKVQVCEVNGTFIKAVRKPESEVLTCSRDCGMCGFALNSYSYTSLLLLQLHTAGSNCLTMYYIFVFGIPIMYAHSRPQLFKHSTV